MNGYEKRALRKRNQIVEAAQGLFFKNGIAGVTVEQVAKAARVSRVTIFKYFGDKDGLVKESVQAWACSLLAAIDSVLESDRPFPEKLTSFFSEFVHLRDETGYKEIRGDRELMGCIREAVKVEGLPRMMALVGQGKCAGAIDPALKDEAILLYFSAFQPIISDPGYIKREKSVQDSLFTMFMRGLMMDWK